MNSFFGDTDFILREIERFKCSPERADMMLGERYARGLHDILWRKRAAVGADGSEKMLGALPNSRVVDNQYLKVLSQKTNYLLGRPFSFKVDDHDYAAALRSVFGSAFRRLLKKIGEDSLCCGRGFVYFGFEGGAPAFKRIPPEEIIPEWRDADCTELDCAIRVYSTAEYSAKGLCERLREFVEVYTKKGIYYFELRGGRLIPREPFHRNYFSVGGREYNWERVPIIAFRADSRGVPLIKRVKSLQDSLNALESNFRNVMEEDVRSSVLVLVNYDGEDLATFRKNLAEYGVVPVRTVDGGAGDVKALRIEVSAENYLAVLRVFKKAIIENAGGFDASDERLYGNPNELNLRSMYSDIDLEANAMEVEFQAAFEKIFCYLNSYFKFSGRGDFSGSEVSVIFDRDILISESEVIENCVRSKGIISDKTIVAMHPWIDDPDAEIKKMREEQG